MHGSIRSEPRASEFAPRKWGILAALLSCTFAASAQNYGMDARSPIGPFLNDQLPPASQSAGGWTVVDAFPNLQFDDPVSVVAEPRTNRLYVCERQGTIHFFVNDPATTTRTLFLDLTAATQGYDDCGLIGMAFHPEYGMPGSTNRGYVYIYYQFSESPTSGPGRPPSATPGFNRLSRFTVADGSLIADPASELILINQFDRHVWHNGGGMFFGPDGFLYLSNGDEGAANDSYNQTQEITSGLFSGVLRIDVDRNPARSHPIRRQPQQDEAPPSGWTNTTFSANYYIPNDNPWLDPSGSVLEEFYAIGLRSPHRMTYDPPTGRVWLGDVGQGTREEVDIIEKGGNYQWAYREGSITGPHSKPTPLIGVDKPPLYDYGRGAGDTCVIGGYVYRGAEHAGSLYGKYIFGDNTSGRIWAMTYDGVNPPSVVELLDTGWPNNYGGLSGFGIDNHNELFICKMGRPSHIYKLARTGPQPPSPPPLLSQTGAFADLATLTPASGLIPYDVNSPLWSDGAVKSRWIAVPNDGAPYGSGEKITFAATGEWSFPAGTVFIKHFELPVDDTNPSIRKRLETRFLIRDTNSTVFGFTYKWREDNSDADLLPGSLLEDVPVQTGFGIRTQRWFYPGSQDCLTCHNPTANHVLGVKTRQLNGDFHYSSTGRTDNQLRTLNHVGLFSPSLNEADIPNYARTVKVTDTSASIEHRVRSYLDANCAHCHRPNGAQALFDARFDTALVDQGLVNGPVVNPMGITGAKVIAPQSVAQSILYQRDGAVGLTQMPPLARNVPDTNYLTVLTQWINSLPPPGALPNPWVHEDIGSVGFEGDATYSDGTFSVTGSGSDIWNTADAFHFVYRSLNGDGTVVARVDGVGNTDPWAKAGVMIRESLTAESVHAFMAITPGNGAAFQRRTSTGGSSSHTAGSSVTAPYWVKLVRSGNTFTGYESANGTSWSTVDTITISMSTVVNVGLAVTAHNNSELCAASFSGLLLTGPNVNSPPTISSFASQVIDEDGIVGPLGFTVGDLETAAVNLSVSASSSNPGLIPTGNISFGGSDVNRTVTLAPLSNQYGTSDVTIAVSDGTNTANAVFELAVNPVNDSPLAGPDTLLGGRNIAVKTRVATLLANDTDVEGDTLTLQSVDPFSSAGGTVAVYGDWVRYAPPSSLPTDDSFSYSVSDGNGGVTNGTVTVQQTIDSSPNSNLTATNRGDGTTLVRGRGIPGQDYQLEFSEMVEPPDWQPLTTLQADTMGAFEYVDAPPIDSPARIYRTITP